MPSMTQAIPKVFRASPASPSNTSMLHAMAGAIGSGYRKQTARVRSE